MYRKRFIGIVGVVMGLILSIPASSWAQEQTEKAPIIAKKKPLFYKYTYQGKDIKGRFYSEFKIIMGDYPDALAQVETAEKYIIPAGIFSGIGGSLIGWPIGAAIGKEWLGLEEDPNWSLVGVGVGFVVIGMSLGVVSDKYIKKAVDIYNARIGRSSGVRSLDIELAFAPNRISVLLRF